MRPKTIVAVWALCAEATNTTVSIFTVSSLSANNYWDFDEANSDLLMIKGGEEPSNTPHLTKHAC